MNLTVLDEDNNTSLSNQIRYSKSLATLSSAQPLTLVESKLVFQVLTQVGYKDNSFKAYRINASELHNELKNFVQSKKAAKKKIKVSDVSSFIEDKSNGLVFSHPL